MAMKKVLIILASVFILLPVLPGCEVQKEVTFDQLFRNPGSYNGRTVSIEGFYFEGFEVVVLAEGLKNSGLVEGHIWPDGHRIWIEGGISNEIRDQMTRQNQVGPNELYGKIRVEGRFQYGERYGHLGGYESQIIPEQVEFIK